MERSLLRDRVRDAAEGGKPANLPDVAAAAEHGGSVSDPKPAPARRLCRGGRRLGGGGGRGGRRRGHRLARRRGHLPHGRTQVPQSVSSFLKVNRIQSRSHEQFEAYRSTGCRVGAAELWAATCRRTLGGPAASSRGQPISRPSITGSAPRAFFTYPSFHPPPVLERMRAFTGREWGDGWHATHPPLPTAIPRGHPTLPPGLPCLPFPWFVQSTIEHDRRYCQDNTSLRTVQSSSSIWTRDLLGDKCCAIEFRNAFVCGATSYVKAICRCWQHMIAKTKKEQNALKQWLQRTKPSSL